MSEYMRAVNHKINIELQPDEYEVFLQGLGMVQMYSRTEGDEQLADDVYVKLRRATKTEYETVEDE